jgi:hypothetical protein
MKCEEVQDILSEYLDGEIAETWRKDWIEKHLAGCPACRAMFSELKHVQESIRSLPVTPAPKEIARKLAAEVEEIAVPAETLVEDMRRTESVIARVPLYRRALPVLMAAAASVLALFVVLQIRSAWKEEEPRSAPEMRMAESKSPRTLPEETAVPKGEESVEALRSNESGAKAAGKPAAGFEVATAPAPPALTPGAPSTKAAAPEALDKDARRADQLEQRIPPLVKKELNQERQTQAGGIVAQGQQAAPAAAAAPAPAEVAKAKAPSEAGARETKERADLQLGAANKGEAKPAPAEKPKMDETGVEVAELEKRIVPPSVQPSDALKGMIERKTLLLRVEDVPAASADVKGILARCGAQVSRDYYENGQLEGAGRRIKAQVPGSRYQTLLTELRKKKYVATEVAKPQTKAAKPAPPARNLMSIPETVIELTINFQVTPAAAAPAQPTAAPAKR